MTQDIQIVALVLIIFIFYISTIYFFDWVGTNRYLELQRSKGISSRALGRRSARSARSAGLSGSGSGIYSSDVSIEPVNNVLGYFGIPKIKVTKYYIGHKSISMGQILFCLCIMSLVALFIADSYIEDEETRTNITDAINIIIIFTIFLILLINIPWLLLTLSFVLLLPIYFLLFITALI